MTIRTTTTLLGLLLGLALVLAVGPAHADACDPAQAANDADGDGYLNRDECPPTKLADGVNYAIPMASCRDSAPPCFDPDRKDLVILVSKDTTNVFGQSALDEPAHRIALSDLFAPMEETVGNGGLDLRVHVVTTPPFLAPSCFRCVTRDQKAMTLTENRDERANTCPSNPPPWGETKWGNPNEFGTAIVYTQRILDGIECFASTVSGLDVDSLKATQLVNSFNHEAGHLIRIAEKDDRKVGHHYALASNCIVDVAPVYEVDRKGNVIITVGETFCGPSQTLITAGQTAEGKGVLCGDFTTEDDLELTNCKPTQ